MLSIALPSSDLEPQPVASITMLPVWNDLWFPLILAPSEENQTVTLGVQQFVRRSRATIRRYWPPSRSARCR